MPKKTDEERGVSASVAQDGRAYHLMYTPELDEARRADGSLLPRLKHVFLVIREDRSFDEVFGDLPGANGDPALARYGTHGWVEDGWSPELRQRVKTL